MAGFLIAFHDSWKFETLKACVPRPLSPTPKLVGERGLGSEFHES